VVDTSTWNDKRIRLYDPRPNPNQCHGECTGCAKCMQLNAVGNRVTGRVLTMYNAHLIYSLASTLDPWAGSWAPPSWEDTGSSGLASSKAAQQLNLAGAYRWVFGGADEAIQTVIDGDAVSVGTWWYGNMFEMDSAGFVEPTGGRVGGHQWILRGYVERLDAGVGRCWWGDEFRDFRIRRSHLNDLLMDDGDAHVQETL
jgi:hypothetical protein